MESNVIKHRRNQLFIHLYGFAGIFHFLLNQLVEMNTATVSPIFGIISYSVLLSLAVAQVNDRTLQFMVLLAMNLYVFILNFESLSSITLIFFVVPIIASALYNDTKPIVILALLTSAEFMLLLTVFDRFAVRAPLPYNQLSMIMFFIAILSITLLDSIYFSHYLKQLESKNASMEKALLSKEGYLHLFFENDKDAIAVFDSNNKVIAVNTAFAELYG